MARKIPSKALAKPQHLKAMALFCAGKGLRVVSLHGTLNGRCTCGDEKCDQLGRHPRTKHGVANATADRSVIEQMWARWPRAKIGIALGENACRPAAGSGEWGRWIGRTTKSETRCALAFRIFIFCRSRRAGIRAYNCFVGRTATQ